MAAWAGEAKQKSGADLVLFGGNFFEPGGAGSTSTFDALAAAAAAAGFVDARAKAGADRTHDVAGRSGTGGDGRTYVAWAESPQDAIPRRHDHIVVPVGGVAVAHVGVVTGPSSTKKGGSATTPALKRRKSESYNNRASTHNPRVHCKRPLGGGDRVAG